MIDFASLLHGPAYSLYGTPATVTPQTGDPALLMVIDRTAGVELSSGDNDRYPGGVSTVRPAALVRVSELQTAGLSRAGLRRAGIAFNGRSWRIESAIPRPTTNGESDGELMLLLTAED